MFVQLSLASTKKTPKKLYINFLFFFAHLFKEKL